VIAKVGLPSPVGVGQATDNPCTLGVLHTAAPRRSPSGLRTPAGDGGALHFDARRGSNHPGVIGGPG